MDGHGGLHWWGIQSSINCWYGNHPVNAFSLATQTSWFPAALLSCLAAMCERISSRAASLHYQPRHSTACSSGRTSSPASPQASSRPCAPATPEVKVTCWLTASALRAWIRTGAARALKRVLSATGRAPGPAPALTCASSWATAPCRRAPAARRSTSTPSCHIHALRSVSFHSLAASPVSPRGTTP